MQSLSTYGVQVVCHCLIFAILLCQLADCQVNPNEAFICAREPATLRQSARVSGGKNAKIGDFPYQVRIESSEEPSVICGGTILSPEWIITTAHCLHRRKGTRRQYATESVSVIAGDLDRTTDDEPTEVKMQVDRIVVHPLYKNATKQFDYNFALIRLSLPLIFDDAISAACLMTDCAFETQPTNILACKASGWGATGDDDEDKEPEDSYSRVLRYAELLIPSRANCTSGMNEALKAGDYNYITERMICAGSPFDRNNTCRGDGGGPLVCSTPATSFQPVLQGITSWGLKGCGDGPYSVYSRPCAVAPWILSTTNIKNSRGKVYYPFVSTSTTKGTTTTTLNLPWCGATKYRTGGASNMPRVDEFPWTVRILAYSDASRRNAPKICTGVYIGSNYVLSSSKCVQSKSDSDIVLQFRIFDANQPAGSVNATVIDWFFPLQDTRDYVLIGVDSELPDAIKPICLPESCDDIDVSNCVGTGWGNIDPASGFVNSTMMRPSFVVKNDSDCGADATGSYGCAGIKRGSLCQLDQGSPLMCYDGASYNLIGLASSVPRGCGEFARSLSSAPVLKYTKICAIRSWILENTGDLESF